jgi:uncharacterized membrane protein YqhA
MRTVFGMSRYLVYIAVLGLLFAALAVFVFAGITTVNVVVESFRHLEYNAEGARAFSVELIEIIDLFLLGTVLLITSIGLYELFIDPSVDEVIPEWLSVTNLEQLKFNLLAVIIVMLGVLFLGAAAGEWMEGTTILQYGAAVGIVVVAFSIAVYFFGRVAHGIETAKAAEHEEVLAQEAHASVHDAEARK